MPLDCDGGAKESRGSSFNIDPDEGIRRTHCDCNIGHLRRPGDIARSSFGLTGVRSLQSLHADCCSGCFGDGSPCLKDDRGLDDRDYYQQDNGPHQRPLERFGNSTLPVLSTLRPTWIHFGKFDDTYPLITVTTTVAIETAPTNKMAFSVD